MEPTQLLVRPLDEIPPLASSSWLADLGSRSMTARVLVLVFLAVSLQSVRAVDLDKLPPMNETKRPADLGLKGREVEAIDVAFRQFRQDHFSISGDLKHFTMEIAREHGKLFIDFLPDIDERRYRITPTRNKYGTLIHYAVSLRTLKIVGYRFERD